MKVRHQIDWALLVSTGRAKAIGVSWTAEELELIAKGEETRESLRKKDSVAALKKEVARLEKIAKEKAATEKKAKTQDKELEEKLKKEEARVAKEKEAAEKKAAEKKAKTNTPKK